MSQNLKYQFAKLNIAEKLIVINVVLFLVNTIVTTLFLLPNDIVSRYFELPKDFFSFVTQPWSIVTYSFFHGSFGHIFWNMIWLYFFGRTFLNLFGHKKFVNVYFLGVIAGGLLFLLSYNVFPALININAALIGASAGVMAILIFVCTYIPNREVRFFVINLKLWHIGVFVVLMDLLQIPSGSNTGGNLAHLGGAILGFVYARQMLNGKDIGEGFSKFLDWCANLFKKSDKAPLKTVYKNKTKTKPKANTSREKESNQRKIDTILDKISKSGYESLSKAEKDFLFKAGKD